MKKSILLLFFILLLVGCGKEKEYDNKNIISYTGHMIDEGVEMATTFTGYFDDKDKLYDVKAVLDIPDDELRNAYCVLADMLEEDNLSCNDGIVTLNHYQNYYSNHNDDTLIGIDKMNFEALLEANLIGKFTCTK